MNWSAFLKAQLRERAAVWVEETGPVAYNSVGTPGTILFPPGDGRHGNLFSEVWAAIEADSEWSDRLTKAHPQRRHLPEEHRADARELDSSNSSDALLMNCFCYPRAAARFAAVLGASPVDARPRFGVPGQVDLSEGVQDRSELDMILGDTIVEAKLTEQDFTTRSKDHVFRYARLATIFDIDALPGDGNSFRGFQMIRNVLAAAQHDRQLVVLIDARRPDLLHEWWSVHAAIARSALCSRCRMAFWQELAKAAEASHRALLETKYGL